jgi:hypothetical protein
MRVLVSSAETKKNGDFGYLNASQAADLEQNRQLIPRLGSYGCATLSPLLLLTINRICCVAIVLGLVHGLGCGHLNSLFLPPDLAKTNLTNAQEKHQQTLRLVLF